MTLKRIIGLLAAGLLSGCTVGPDYHTPPEVKAGADWAEHADTRAPSITPWWQTLRDATLDDLVTRALASNPDLQASRARIAESRAARDAAFARLLPQAGVAGGINMLRQSENGPLPLRQIPFIPRDETIRDIEFDASWDADLFGGQRRAVESARALQQAAVATDQDLRLSLVAELVRDYLVLRGEQREQAILADELSVLTDNESAARARVLAGDAPQSVLDQATQARENLASQLPALTGSLHGLALSIGILTGRPPESGLALLDSQGQFPSLAPIPVGQRAEVLRRRPDVRAAERKLAAATANIGIATAQWFPQLTIGASAGFQSLQPGNLFTMPSQTGSIFPLISWQILDGGRIRAQIHAAEAQQQQAAQTYVSTVLAALADAERALSDYQQALQSVHSNQAALAAASSADNHSAQSFAAGESNRQDRLASRLTMLQAQFGAQQARTLAAVDWVALEKALALPVEPADITSTSTSQHP